MTAATEQAHRAIRAAIAAGVYKGGDHLRAAELAERFGTSRTPIREALQRLSSEGVVDFVTNRGAYVTEWSREDVEEIFDMRTVLEGRAAELSATRLTLGQIDDLRLMTGRMEDAAHGDGRRDAEAVAKHNNDFHALIISAAANRRLAALIGSVFQMALTERTFSVFSDEDLHRSLTHHRELIAAFQARDPVWAGSVMRSHLCAAHHVYVTAAGRPTEEAAAAEAPAEGSPSSRRRR